MEHIKYNIQLNQCNHDIIACNSYDWIVDNYILTSNDNKNDLEVKNIDKYDIIIAMEW